MPILLNEPIEKPAIPAKTYDAVWLYNLVATCPTITLGGATLEVLPFNSQTGEIGPTNLGFTITTNDLFAAVAQVPEVQVAFTAVLNCILPLKAWVDAQNTPPEPE